MKKLELIATVGLPASGKSTWAKQQVAASGYKRFNRDDLRAMIDVKKWSKGNEKFIVETQNLLVLAALAQGHSVIVDDTNLHPDNITRLQGLAEQAGAEFRTESFLHVPVDVCIARDKERGEASVGRKVILRMFNDYIRPQSGFRPEYNVNLPECVVCDLDGTLAVLGNRSPYDTGKCDVDTVDERVSEVLDMHRAKGRAIVFLTGSKEMYRAEREAWLQKHGIEYDHLYMRWDGDGSPDYNMKRRTYESEIRRKYNVVLVLEDRQQVVDMWRSLGLTTWQVDFGDF